MSGLVHLVEDDPDAAALLAELLGLDGLDCSVQATLAGLQAQPDAPSPTAVVSDFHLADGHTGAEVLLLARQRWPGARLVLVSGLDGDAVRAELERWLPGLSTQVTVLPKPLDYEQLIAVLG